MKCNTALLHQVEPSLPAWYIAKHLHAGVGERTGLRRGYRLCLFWQLPWAHVVGGFGACRRCPAAICFFDPSLVHQTQEQIRALYNNESQNRDYMKKDYKPQPIDTSDVALPDGLDMLIEYMSKNVHEVWAETRIRQGWTYGPQRDDTLKTHPSLIPYEELPEEEKEFDRNTSIGTLKLIQKLGFKISK